MPMDARPPVRLNRANLSRLKGRVDLPRYDPARLSPGIVHFGVGNFHRAHQAAYLDDLFNANAATGHDFDWGIVGAGVFASEAAVRDILMRQDFLTTLVEQSAVQSLAHVTAPMTGYVEPGNGKAIVDQLADPAIRIVSLTITEGGYFIDAATGIFNPDHEAIVADGREPEAPKTVFGLIVAALKRRRAEGVDPFTVMSCDNIPHNGVVARNAVIGTARRSDASLADWIGGEVAFPNGMVDRITPATADRERRICAGEFGVEDAWPVFCEDFRQWVLEDDFPAGRPRLEEVGVQFVPDVTPYENMKIRILNGGHAIIAYPAGLMGIEFAHEAMGDPLVTAFLEKVEGEEILPFVPPVPDTDLDAYYARVKERFANPKIADTVRRLCLDGSNRQPKFIIPSIADALARGADVSGLALASALWCRYCYGMTDAGDPIEPNDPNWQRLNTRAQLARDEPGAWLEMTDIYGAVGQAPPFRQAFARWLHLIWSEGTGATLKRYLAD